MSLPDPPDKFLKEIEQILLNFYGQKAAIKLREWL